MDKQEFLLLIPAIIYGVAVVDLLKIFSHRKNYWEQLAWGILLMIIIINTWIELYQKLDSIVDNNLNFFIIIVQAIIYAQAAGVITPEKEDTDTKEYFFSIRKIFFLILAGATAFNLLMQYVVYDDNQALWLRPTAIALMLLCAFVDKLWFRSVILLILSTIAIMIVFVT